MNDWIKVGKVEDFSTGTGDCLKVKDEQIAVFNFPERNEWYAVQNLCPHKQQMVLSRGMTGSCDEKVKVVCPLHKYSFALASGEYLGDGECESIRTYPIKVEESSVYLKV